MGPPLSVNILHFRAQRNKDAGVLTLFIRQEVLYKLSINVDIIKGRLHHAKDLPAR